MMILTSGNFRMKKSPAGRVLFTTEGSVLKEYEEMHRPPQPGEKLKIQTHGTQCSFKDEPIHLSWPSSRALQGESSRKYSVVSTSAAGEKLGKIFNEDKFYYLTFKNSIFYRKRSKLPCED